jgi:hypothetical protein
MNQASSAAAPLVSGAATPGSAEFSLRSNQESRWIGIDEQFWYWAG